MGMLASRVRIDRLGLGGLLSTVLLVAGCGESVMPKGSGASGRLQGAQVEPQETLGLKELNKLTEDQQRTADYLQQPFDKVFSKGGSGKAYDILKEGWDKLPFIDAPGDERHSYAVRIETNVAAITFNLAPDSVPNVVRSFLLLAEAGYFDDQPFTAEDAVATVDADKGASAPRIEPIFFSRAPGEGSLVMLTDAEGLLPVTSFSLTSKPAPELLGKATAFGVVYTSIGRQNVAKIVDQAHGEPGSVRIKSVEVLKNSEPLFSPMSSEPAIPKLGANGLPPGLVSAKELELLTKPNEEPKDSPPGKATPKTEPKKAMTTEPAKTPKKPAEPKPSSKTPAKKEPAPSKPKAESKGKPKAESKGKPKAESKGKPKAESKGKPKAENKEKPKSEPSSTKQTKESPKTAQKAKEKAESSKKTSEKGQEPAKAKDDASSAEKPKN
ncbi:Cyclophilin type peptidyl-prolyl cis-trans isomerase/CLD [Planctomycetes bacterium Pan216]|uniref:Cyclophilin type peptidyl-prolyl cis-trans isomerase/CLD n=1 Tax=Kolteria novifilia TaxID=2527975 RepID=A0A518BAK4_9BACT|nr:Cyclophilin type peptidyl-prolyl cis-trans isomerase/CLD [Planctomycetes bacterium Pan216]